MKRRIYLSVVAGALGAGCTATGESPSTTPAPDDSESQQSTTMTPAEHGSFDPASTFKTIDITTETTPHTVVIWNAKDTTREITVQLHKRRTDAADTTTVLDQVFEFPADEALELRLIDPANYTVIVTAPERDSPKELHIPQDQFDCNTHKHQVAVRADGSIDVSGFSTTMLCNSTTDE